MNKGEPIEGTTSGLNLLAIYTKFLDENLMGVNKLGSNTRHSKPIHGAIVEAQGRAPLWDEEIYVRYLAYQIP
jgi:hypothetical protein